MWVTFEIKFLALINQIKIRVGIDIANKLSPGSGFEIDPD
jgi:hypothetical protein